MRPARPGLRVARPGDRRAHLLAHRLRDVLEALVVDFEDAPEQRQPLGLGGQRKGRERGLGRRDGAVDIGLRADRNLRVGLLGRRIDDVEQRRLDRVDPLAVDVELR